MHGPTNVKSPNNTSKWQMKFNSAFNGLSHIFTVSSIGHSLTYPACSKGNLLVWKHRNVHLFASVMRHTSSSTNNRCCRLFPYSWWRHMTRSRNERGASMIEKFNDADVCLWILCVVDRASRYYRVNKSQLDAQLILSIFRQHLHVSGVSRPIIRSYNRMYTTVGTYY
jgi:hypothetical protein